MLAFGAERRWWLFDANTHHSMKIDIPDDLDPTGLTVSRDGRLIVLAAFSKAAQTHALYQLEPGSSAAPRRITSQVGYFADPAIDSTTKYVYATFIPGRNGKPMSHAERKYAEIYRFDLGDGSATQATHSQGCHFSPAVGRRDQITYIHAACFNPSATVDIQTGSETHSKHLVSNSSAKDPTLSPDGRVLAYTHLYAGVMSVARVSTATGKVLSDVELARSDDHPRPQFGCDRRTLYVYSQSKVFKVSESSAVAVGVLKEQSK